MNKVNLLIFLVCLCIVSSCTEHAYNNSLPGELVANGYKYILFGSQRTNGIEVYDLGKNQFIDLLKSEDKNIRYFSPVVDNSGIGYCIEEKYPLDAKKVAKIIEFDLHNMRIVKKYADNIYNNYVNLALSSDGKRLAYITSRGFRQGQTAPYLTIFDTKKKMIVKKIAIDKRFSDNPTKLIWMPDSETVVMWHTVTWLPAVGINIKTQQTQTIKYPYPLAFYQDKYVALIERDKTLMPAKIIDLKRNKDFLLPYGVHTVRLSRDGKYVVSASISSNGEIITITDTENFGKKFDVKLHNYGTVLGMDIW